MAFPQVVALLITNLPEVWGFAHAFVGPLRAGDVHLVGDLGGLPLYAAS